MNGCDRAEEREEGQTYMPDQTEREHEDTSGSTLSPTYRSFYQLP